MSLQGLEPVLYATCAFSLCAPYIAPPAGRDPLPSRIARHALRLVASFVLLSAAAVFLGAPLWSSVVAYRWAAVQTALSSGWVVHIVSISGTPVAPSQSEAALLVAEAAALLGAWAGALLCPYDWGYEWQIWPTPSYVGAVVLFWAGGAAAAALQWLRSSRGGSGAEKLASGLRREGEAEGDATTPHES